jgi:hypothetical protein
MQAQCISSDSQCNQHGNASGKRARKQHAHYRPAKRSKVATSPSRNCSPDDVASQEQVSESSTPASVTEYVQKIHRQHSRAVGHLVAMHQRCEHLVHENALLKAQIQALLKHRESPTSQESAVQDEAMPSTPNQK